MQKSAAEAYRRAIHENELARHQLRTPFPQGLVNNKGFLAAILRWRDAICDAPYPVVEEGRVDEPRPNVQGFGEILGETAKAPGFIGMYGAFEIIVQQSLIEIDHAADEFGRENPDATVIEEVDATRFMAFLHPKYRIISEVRISMDDSKAAERNPPRLEHRTGNTIAR